MNTRPPYRGQAENAREVLAPSKMVAPLLLSRMKERHDSLRERVYTCDLRVLGAIAALTSQGKIIQSIISALLAWVDMFDAEGLRGETSRAAAVFAEAAGALRYLGFLFQCDALWHPGRLHPQLAKHLIERDAAQLR